MKEINSSCLTIRSISIVFVFILLLSCKPTHNYEALELSADPHYSFVFLDRESLKELENGGLTRSEFETGFGLKIIDIISLNLLTPEECLRVLYSGYRFQTFPFLGYSHKITFYDYYTDKEFFSIRAPSSHKLARDFRGANKKHIPELQVESDHKPTILSQYVLSQFVSQDPLEGWWTTEDQRIFILIHADNDRPETFIGDLIYSTNLEEKRYSKVLEISKAASDSLYLGYIWVNQEIIYTSFFLSSDLILSPGIRKEGNTSGLTLIKMRDHRSEDPGIIEEIKPLLAKQTI